MSEFETRIKIIKENICDINNRHDFPIRREYNSFWDRRIYYSGNCKICNIEPPTEKVVGSF